jgi:hypothetical protein
MPARLEARREGLHRARIDDAIISRREDERGFQNAARVFGIGELRHQAKRRVQPADGWIADGETGGRRDDGRVAAVAPLVGRQAIALEGFRKSRCVSAAGNIGAAESDRVERFGEQPRRAGKLQSVDVDEGTNERQPLERGTVRASLRKQNGGAHGVS